MKTIIRFILLCYTGIIFNGCIKDLEINPSDKLTGGSLGENIEGLTYMTNGNYALLKDGITFQGFLDDNNCYLRQYYQLSDFASDDIVCGQKTEDPLYFSFTYTHSPNQTNVRYFWYVSYKIINGANTVIEVINNKGELTDEEKQLLGENYFLRAFSTFNLARLFAKPYAISNPEIDLGVILRLTTSEPGNKARATLKETYETILSDLLTAENLMNGSRGKEFASKEATQALLSRVYLYMNDYDNAIKYTTFVIESSNYRLETKETYPDYFANAISHNETIWLVAFTSLDNRGKFGSIASMLYSDGSSGWGEEFASPTYRELLNQNPDDVRKSYIVSQTDDEGNVSLKNGIEIHYITKFSFQEGDPNLASPVMFRLAEMYLNRAEAYAKKGNTPLALADVNEIRKNRGLENNLYDAVPGGKTLLEIVLEERRLELAFEGHRFYDVFRNQQNMDRSYWGYHIAGLTVSEIDLETNPPASIDNLIIEWDDSSILYYIPVDEINTNNLCVQN